MGKRHEGLLTCKTVLKYVIDEKSYIYTKEYEVIMTLYFLIQHMVRCEDSYIFLNH